MHSCFTDQNSSVRISLISHRLTKFYLSNRKIWNFLHQNVWQSSQMQNNHINIFKSVPVMEGKNFRIFIFHLLFFLFFSFFCAVIFIFIFHKCEEKIIPEGYAWRVSLSITLKKDPINFFIGKNISDTNHFLFHL